MTTVYTADGQPIELDPQQALAAWRAGQVGFGPEAQMVRTNKGQMVQAGGEDLVNALVGGGSLMSPAEVEQQQRVDEWDTAGGAVLTAAASAGNTLTLGAMDYAGSQLIDGYAEERRAMLEANPTADTVGMVGGELLGVALTGGGSALLKGGAKAGAAALGKSLVREAAETAVQQGTARVIAQRAVKEAAEGAIEAALFQTGQTISQMSINEQDITAERLLASAGEAAAYGGAFGGLFGAVAGGVSEAGKAIGTAAKKGARGIKNAITEAVPELQGAKSLTDVIENRAERIALEQANLGELSRAAADVSTGPRPQGAPSRVENGLRALREGDDLAFKQTDDLARKTDNVAAVEAKLNELATPEASRRQVTGITKDLDEAAVPTAPIRSRAAEQMAEIRTQWGVGDKTRAQIKRELNKSTRALNKAQQAGAEGIEVDALRDQVARLQGELDDTLDIGARSPLSEQEKSNVLKFQKEVQNLEAEYSKLAAKGEWSTRDSAEWYQMLDKFKRNLTPFVSQRSRFSELVKGKARRMHDKLRVELTDESLWGVKRAQTAKKHNELITRYYDKRGGLSRLQQSKAKRVQGLDVEADDLSFDPDDFGSFTQVRQVDSAKMEGFAKKLGTRANDTVEQDLLDHISAIEANNEAAYLRGSISEKTFRENGAALQAWRDSWGDNMRRVTDADAYSAAWRIKREAFGLNAAKVDKAADISPGEAYTAIGSILTGSAAGVLGTAASVGLTMLPKHFDDFQRAAAGMAGLARTQNKTAQRVSAAAKGILGKAAKGARAVRKTAQTEAAKRLSARDEFEQNMAAVKLFQEQPQLAMQRAVNSMGPMASATPRTAEAFRAKLMQQVDMMLQRMPTEPGRTLYLQGKKPNWKRYSTNDVRKFNDYCRGLGNPLQVIANVEAGTVSADELEGFRAGFPHLYNDLRGQIEAELYGLQDALPRSVEIKVQKLFGFALTPSWQPASIAGLQQIARGESGAPQRDEAAVAPSAASAPDMAESFATRTGQILGNVRG